jgi:hypothetical protein
LCAPELGAPDPVVPIWARRTIGAFSAPGERVVIRALSTYPGLVGEVAALTAATSTSGRHPLALLPTPAGAARTRATLPALLAALDSPHSRPDPEPPTTPGQGANWLADLRRNQTDDRAQTVTTADLLAECSDEARAHWALGGARVGVGRRRPSAASGPAGLVVVLGGPVVAGARSPRRRITGRMIEGWARVLRPGGLLVLLRPAEFGARRGRPESHGQVVRAAQDAGLRYLQHIVLVHVPTTEHGLAQPGSTRRPHAPFWPIHTDALVLATAPDPTGPAAAIPTSPAGPNDHTPAINPNADTGQLDATTHARTEPPPPPIAGHTDTAEPSDPPTMPILPPPTAAATSTPHRTGPDGPGGPTAAPAPSRTGLGLLLSDVWHGPRPHCPASAKTSEVTR